MTPSFYKPQADFGVTNLPHAFVSLRKKKKTTDCRHQINVKGFIARVMKVSLWYCQKMECITFFFYQKKSSDSLLNPPSTCVCLGGYWKNLLACLKLFLSPCHCGTAFHLPGSGSRSLMTPQPSAEWTRDGYALSEGHLWNPDSVRKIPACREIWHNPDIQGLSDPKQTLRGCRAGSLAKVRPNCPQGMSEETALSRRECSHF